ncbi:flagellar protein FliT [Paenibacillus sp.]|uniref:flagellar protein FliT n=1 Tax=Paenibacillus sp. TaxID=58172 RepID=UPI0028B1C6DA|nr:flagellar protein FliT [Paenibacillus sp.]
MDELILSLDQLTRGIVDHLQEISYEELEFFVEDRQEIVDSIAEQAEICKSTPAQKQEINRILEYDNVILDRMNALRLEAQDWLQKRNQAKVQRSAYEAAYTPDSFLMDRRK